MTLRHTCSVTGRLTGVRQEGVPVALTPHEPPRMPRAHVRVALKEATMLKTPLCDLLGIEHPVILAAMGSATSAAFAAAVSNAGGLGSIATIGRPTEEIIRDLDSIRGLTDRPFAVNHVPQTLDETAFAATLRLRPAVISFALGDPGDLVRRAHDAGAT